MQLIFSTAFGCHSKSSFMLNNAELINVKDTERNAALSQGWLLTSDNGEVKWYMSRSTRVKLSDTNYLSTVESVAIDRPLPLDVLDKIYDKYCQHKHYKKYFEVNQFLDLDIVRGYYHNSKITAWTKLRCYDSANIESVLFVWDYADPGSHLGIHSLKSEIAWAKQQGYDYFYMGPGYEKNSIYKSDIDGFEWWTGKEWSRDKDKYIWLCKRDSKIASHHQIHSVLSNLQHDRNNP